MDNGSQEGSAPLSSGDALLTVSQTYVAYNQWPGNRQAHNFRHPNSFIPERFLTLDSRTDNMASFQPFGMGRHGCIGMKLAYAMMRVTLARLLFTFDISLADKKDRWDWGEQKTYILWVSRVKAYRSSSG